MAAKEDILTVDEKSQNQLVQYVKACSYLRDEGWQLRQRLEEVDRNYMREYDYTDDQQKAKLANRRGDPNKIQNMQTPLVLEGVETSVGSLSEIFTNEYPMFKLAAGPKNEDIALMWNTLVGEDQLEFGWSGEFNQAFRNGEKYNFAPLEVEWVERNKYRPVNGTGKGGVTLEQQIYCGNSISAYDPYNTIYDPRVPPHLNHIDGEFVGRVQMMSRIKLKQFLANLGEKRLKNDKKAFTAPNWEVSYYVPYINPTVTVRTQNWLLGAENFDWTKWATNEAQQHIAYKNMYTVVTVYARIMPYEFGIRAPKDQTPDIWKLIVVNGILVYAQPVINAHDILPVIIGSPLVDNLTHQTKTPAENIADYQFLINALINAKLAGARRRVFDRMLYNPLLIDPDHMNSPNPTAKIPIRPTAYGRKLEEALYQIPFHDENGAQFIQESQLIMGWAQRAQGQNNVNQGQFQKGNKLQDEFSTVMSKAGARDRTKALMWENFVMQPVKTVLKSNYLQMVPEGKRWNRKEEKTVDIDPVKLRSVEAEFIVGDGLTTVQRQLHGDVLEHAMQTMAQAPAIGQNYEVGDMYAYILKLAGVDDLDQFRKDPTKVQYESALRSWQGAMTEALKYLGSSLGNGKFLTVEDVKNLVGPMPQPPQPVQPQPGQPPNAA
jgi:hypothetical protein